LEVEKIEERGRKRKKEGENEKRVKMEERKRKRKKEGENGSMMVKTEERG
jgi:hypothetical protein